MSKYKFGDMLTMEGGTKILYAFPENLHSWISEEGSVGTLSEMISHYCVKEPQEFGDLVTFKDGTKAVRTTDAGIDQPWYVPGWGLDSFKNLMRDHGGLAK